MLDILTVSFFGHRYIENVLTVENRVEEILQDLIDKNEYVEILVGKNGDFDRIVSCVAKRLKKDNEMRKLAIVWVQPYMQAEYLANSESFEEYYDSIEICEKSAKAHFKSAIQTRNRCMIDRSDLVVCCVNQKGGAYLSRLYAERQGKTIIDI